MLNEMQESISVRLSTQLNILQIRTPVSVRWTADRLQSKQEDNEAFLREPIPKSINTAFFILYNFWQTILLSKLESHKTYHRPPKPSL